MSQLNITYTVLPDGKIPEPQATQIREFHKKMAGKQVNTKSSNERQRSVPQNNWLHKVIQLITDFVRESKKERGDPEYYKVTFDRTKLWVKEEFLGYVEIDGELQLRKTSNLKTFEMNELWDNLQIYFAPLGLDIPSPNEKDYRKGQNV